jgi:hypothetical protein
MKPKTKINRLLLMITVLLLLIAFGALTASADEATGFNSGIQIQNLENTTASINIIAYNKDGTKAADVTDSIPANGSKTYFPLDHPSTDPNQPGLGISGSFDGSVVVSSNKQVAAISNVLATGSNGLTVAASYGSLSNPASEVTLPLIMKNNGGFDTKFNVQNTSSSDVNVTVTYTARDANSGNSGCQQTATIKPGSATTFDQRVDSNFTNCTGGLEGDDGKFVGSAKVVATGGQVVASALEVGSTTLFGYNGFTAGTTNPVFPLVNANNAGFITGIQVANLGTQSTDVTISYTPRDSNSGTACTETKTVPAGSSTTFAIKAFAISETGENCANGAKFVGSGSVSANTTNQPLVGIVNQLNSASNKGAAYNAFGSGGGTASVNLPLMMDNNGGAKFFTGYSILNVGADPVDITCTYSVSKTGGHTPAPATATGVAPGEAMIRNDNGQLRPDNSTPYVGSAVCTATGTGETKIVGIVNELAASGSGDLFLVYEGFNK